MKPVDPYAVVTCPPALTRVVGATLCQRSGCAIPTRQMPTRTDFVVPACYIDLCDPIYHRMDIEILWFDSEEEAIEWGWEGEGEAVQ
jgi:hypothetical protein